MALAQAGRGIGSPRTVPGNPGDWKNEALAAKWSKIREVRKVVTGALEIERREKRIGSSLEAAPVVHVTNAELLEALKGEDFAEICITSDIVVDGSEVLQRRSASMRFPACPSSRSSPKARSAHVPGR